MRQVVGYALWIGNAGDLDGARAVMAKGVEVVMEFGESEQFAVLPRELVRWRFPLSDGGDHLPWLLRLAAESLATLIRVRVPTLVCCSAGMSRSVCVAAGGLALVEDLPLSVTYVDNH